MQIIFLFLTSGLSFKLASSWLNTNLTILGFIIPFIFGTRQGLGVAEIEKGLSCLICVGGAQFSQSQS